MTGARKDAGGLGEARGFETPSAPAIAVTLLAHLRQSGGRVADLPDFGLKFSEERLSWEKSAQSGGFEPQSTDSWLQHEAVFQGLTRLAGIFRAFSPFLRVYASAQSDCWFHKCDNSALLLKKKSISPEIKGRKV